MQITYQNKKMIVKHPSGVISEYTRDDLSRFKNDIHKDIADLNKQAAVLDVQPAEIDKSAVG